MEKYLANAVVNKAICAYIIINNYCFNVPEKIKYSQPHYHMCGRKYSSLP